MHDNSEQELVEYVKDHPVVVVGTVDKNSQPFGAAVYAYASSAKLVYFITKSETQKFKNILYNPKVSITIVDHTDNSSLQAHGTAQVVSDDKTIETVMRNMVKVYAQGVDWLPPLSKIQAGSYEVIAVELSHARLAKYKDKHAGSNEIFKEI